MYDMPQESYDYSSNYISHNHDLWDDSKCLYENDDYWHMGSVVVPQPVNIGLGMSFEVERENLEMELLGSANNGGYMVSSTFITATNKNNSIFDESKDTYNDWINKPVKQWTRTDIMSWLVSVSTDNGLNFEQVMLSGFRECTDGMALSNMTEDDFLKMEPNHGYIFYKALKEIMHRWGGPMYNDAYRGHHSINNALPGFDTILPDGERQTTDSMSNWHNSQISNVKTEEKGSSDGESEGENPEPKPVVKKKSVGRPPKESRSRRRKQEKKCGRLWEFIRDLLKDNNHCPNDICWVDHDEGTFRFVKSEKVAKLWGDIKENPKMNYEKLSRAMRYYYKSQVLLPVLGRRLVYKFGPNATNWRSNNPNFRF
ncbi:hypothetical protein J437_LFUL009447 [Ladona fulva]|uniref:Uncharacterized protein n=1 Tax=Ladona fulva TaxID=123851 RepID=A0A8K0K861_LADFU|nr:hypothetical protein J437_LFUL009447 [Ladona fulva]